MYKKRFFTFSPTTHEDKWILSSLKNNFQTMVNIVITDPTRPDLVQHASTMTMHVATVAIQDKA